MVRSAILVLVLALCPTMSSPAHAGWLYTNGDPGIMKVDSNTGAVLGVLVATAPGTEFGHILLDRKGELLVEESPDDVTGNIEPGQILRYDALTGARLGVFVANGSGGLVNPDGMAFGPDGNLYVLDFVNDQTWVVRKYDGASGAPLGNFITAPAGFFIGPVFGPDGTLYLLDNALGTVRKFNGQTGAPIGLVAPAGSMPNTSGLAFGPDGTLYVAVSAPVPVIRVYNPATGTLVREIDARGLPRAGTMLFAPDGTIFLNTLDVPPGGILRLSTSGVVTQLVPSSTLVVSDSLSFTCNPQVNQVCMLDGRFRAEVDWQTADGQKGEGRPISYSDDTSEFWFFGPGNLEMVAKVIDGCQLNQHYWVFAGGLTNVAVTLTVTDTQTGKVKTYTNAQGATFKPIQDTAAFANCS